MDVLRIGYRYISAKCSSSVVAVQRLHEAAVDLASSVGLRDYGIKSVDQLFKLYVSRDSRTFP